MAALSVRGGGVGLLAQVLGISGLQALYDPSDLTSLYQSRTGGSTGAVDSVVGIMLDKSEMGGKTAANFIAGQSELVSNGTFDSDTTGWTGSAATLAAVGGRLVITATGASTGARLAAITTVAGQWYRLTADLVADAMTGNSFVCVGTSAGAVDLGLLNLGSVTGSYTLLFRATSTASHVSLTGSSGSLSGETLTWDNVSVKHIPGYHALAPSDAARPILRSASGKNYLDADGTDDWMQIFPTLNLGEQWWHVGGWQSDAATDAPFATSNRNQSALSQSGNWSWYTAEFGVGLMVSGTITSPHVLTVEQASASSLTGRINGTSGSAIDPYDGSTPTNGLALFSRNNNAFSVGLDGRFYGGAFGTGTLSSSDRALLERYVAGLTGVAL